MSPKNDRPHTYQAVIVGGGPAGATAAVMLARAGWSVAVVEKAGFPRRKVCGEFLSATALPLLRELGVAESFLALAGPAVRRVGLFVKETVLLSNMPRADTRGEGGGSEIGLGRALGREHLDTLLLQQAAEAGATIWQPWTVAAIDTDHARHTCRLVSKAKFTDGQTVQTVRAPVVILAHGSWEAGSLPTQTSRPGVRHVKRPSDLMAFKAHFLDTRLEPGLMPLLVFPGGYGGMVHSNSGLVSLSCCIRRDSLERCRRAWPHVSAAEAVFEHIRASCRGAHDALADARLAGPWLSVGPIRPVLRPRQVNGLFLIGNAAGEAHPIIAEGIAMAMQSAKLLCELLIGRQQEAWEGRELSAITRDYSRRWQQTFSSRLYAGAFFSALTLTPYGTASAVAALERFPSMLTAGARWSGKTALSGSLSHGLLP